MSQRSYLGKRLMLVDLIAGAAKRSRSSTKGKKPLSSSAVATPKQPRLTRDEGKGCFWFI